jgi:hypothetical protein
MRALARVVTTVAALAAALTGAAAAQAAFNFSDPVALPKSLPGDDQFQGGEPSMAFDPAGDGHLYAVAPGSDGSNGVGFWASPDNGAAWPIAKPIGSLAGGFDSDIEVGIDHTVYALDLEVASSAVCRSHDFGKTFEDGCATGEAENQEGAEEDRQWLTHDPVDPNVLYFNYHDLALQYPILEKSTDGGSSFSPCAQTIDPATQPGLFPASIGNTIVGKVAVDRAGNIYVPVGAPTPAQVAQGASTGAGGYGQIVIAYNKGCNGDQFKNTTVWSDDTANFANLFISNAVGPDGTLFVIASGQLNDRDGFNTYLWISRDGAHTFSKPIKVNSPDLRSNVMSAVAAGTKPGQVALGWYGSQNATDPNDTKGIWHYYAAKSDDYGRTWQRSIVTPNPFHYGDICTVGILCTSGNRNLLDFSSIGVNPKTGRYTVVIPGDPFNTFDREESGDTDASAAYVACEGGCGLPKAGGGTQQVRGVSANCHDRTAPVSAISRKRSRVTRRGIRLVGLATDRGCGPGGRGAVARETLAISRRVGKQCQWLRPNGRFSSKRSCRRKVYVSAKGTSKWTYRLRTTMRPGIYAVVARAFDSVGNIERPVRGSRKRAKHNHNHYLFKVR